MQSPIVKGLLLVATFLGLLGCLVAQGALDSQPASSSLASTTGQAAINSSGANSTGEIGVLRMGHLDCTVTDQVEISQSEDDFVVEEDSMELSRLETRQRTYGIDYGMTGAKFASDARRPRLSISLPLLV